MVWDKTKPQGSEPLQFGDDRIRELKADIETALTYEHYFVLDEQNNIVDCCYRIFNSIPEVILDGILYYDETNNILNMRVDNTWEPIGMPNDLFPIDCILIGSLNGFFWQEIITYYQNRCIRLTNDYNQANSIGGSYDPNQFVHSHNLSNFSIQHSHSFSGTTSYSKPADNDGYGWDKIELAGGHNHSLSFILPNNDFIHSHTVGGYTVNFRTKPLKVYKRIY